MFILPSATDSSIATARSIRLQDGFIQKLLSPRIEPTTRMSVCDWHAYCRSRPSVLGAPHRSSRPNPPWFMFSGLADFRLAGHHMHTANMFQVTINVRSRIMSG